jgi:uncharacterized protein YbjT (DUF2867 family)
MKKALIFGSTGFVGSHLLKQLLSSPDYEQVTAVVRKESGVCHPKLKTVISDYNALPALETILAGDEIFIALGTTKKKSPDKAEYYRVDHDYPVLAARIARAQGARAVFLVSAVGANPDSKFFYVRTKGETERDIIALDFEHTHFFRPSMILGCREESRPFEKILIGAWSLINPLLVGNADRYRGISGEDIAKAMRVSATLQADKLNIYHWREMHALIAGS